MKRLFTAIRQGDFEKVKELIEKKPELVNCVAKQPPKKDDGQSPLQVAFKAGTIKIVHYLIEKGANVNFIESKNCCNTWRAPVLHDAINAACGMARYEHPTYKSSIIQKGNETYPDYIRVRSKAKFEIWFQCLILMIEKGSDVNAIDSHGSSCLRRAITAANLPVKCNDDIFPYNIEYTEDISRIIKLLVNYGAKFDNRNDIPEEIDMQDKLQLTYLVNFGE